MGVAAGCRGARASRSVRRIEAAVVGALDDRVPAGSARRWRRARATSRQPVCEHRRGTSAGARVSHEATSPASMLTPSRRPALDCHVGERRRPIRLALPRSPGRRVGVGGEQRVRRARTGAMPRRSSHPPRDRSRPPPKTTHLSTELLAEAASLYSPSSLERRRALPPVCCRFIRRARVGRTGEHQERTAGAVR
jgi:hypothetical protein